MSKSLLTWLSRYWSYMEDVSKIIDCEVKHITTDSRDIKPHTVFIAQRGYRQHGSHFVRHAIENGVMAVLMDSKDKAQLAAEWPQMPDTIFAMHEMHDFIEQIITDFYPQVEELVKVGVTGTNGKTSVTQLIAQLASRLRVKSAVIGTLGAGIMGLDGQLSDIESTANTTPGLALNCLLMDQFVADDCQLVAMEVSSAGLDQARVTGLNFAAVVMTNLTQDHLDYHGDMASYAEAKRQLFEQNPDAVMVLNIDDQTAKQWYQDYHQHSEVIAIGAYDPSYANQEHLMFEQLESLTSGFRFVLRSHLGQAKVELPLYGEFNVYNLLSAMAVLTGLQRSFVAEFELQHLVDAVAGLVAVNGRMERLGDQPAAIVDYAHTPDALAQALGSLKSHCDGKLWCVFGCGGDRDKSKRPLMAQAAQKYADVIVLTNDNPRHEDPEQIIEQIKAGFALETQVNVQIDRKLAIAETLAQANNDDIVLIAGKGHETYQIFGNDVIEYDERAYVRQCCIGNANTVNEDMTS